MNCAVELLSIPCLVQLFVRLGVAVVIRRQNGNRHSCSGCRWTCARCDSMQRYCGWVAPGATVQFVGVRFGCTILEPKDTSRVGDSATEPPLPGLTTRHARSGMTHGPYGDRTAQMSRIRDRMWGWGWGGSLHERGRRKHGFVVSPPTPLEPLPFTTARYGRIC